MEYYYKIYGLIIRSEIEFLEAYETDERPAEVEIKYGSMPEYIKRKQEDGYHTSVLLREYKWFYFHKEGHFLIERGTCITVELDESADERHIRALILGACLGSIMYQREQVAIHGAAVVWQDKAIIVSGISGAGKSTISAELRKKGCLFLADDTVAITALEGSIYANPAYPQQKLCSDAAIDFGYDLKDLILLEEGRMKYAVRLMDSFCKDNREVAALVCVDVLNADQLLVEEITGNRKLEYVLKNLYNYIDFKNIGMNTNVFKKCLEIAQKVPVFRVERTADKNTAARLAEQILSAIEVNSYT
jgi:hypothetical protein